MGVPFAGFVPVGRREMKTTAHHNLAYGFSWLFILAFFARTVDLLLNVQKDWAQSNEVTRIDQDVHALFNPWRNLNRPGNDVLENYEVDLQVQALARYLDEYAQARAKMDAHRRSRSPNSTAAWTRSRRRSKRSPAPT